tara:strand:+ start:1623 stop:3047 length:1425 start_codon:yes stop_codon:yes gene_type:complete
LLPWLQERLAGGALQEIRQPDPLSLSLSFRVPGETLHLLLATGPGRSRVHTLTRPPRNPITAQAFQGLLRKELRGSLQALELIPNDRVLRFLVQRRDQPSRTLIAELTDRHGNFFLLDQEQRILGSARAPCSPTRPLNRQDRWTRPPLHEPRPGQRFAGCDGAERDQKIREHYLNWEQQQSLEALRRKLLGPLRARTKTLRRTARKQRAEAERGDRAHGYRREAELLQSSFHLLAKGLNELEVVDYHQDPPGSVRIELNPRLSPGEQIQARYQQAKRAERSGTVAGQRLQQSEAELERLEALIEACCEATEKQQLQQLEGRIPGGRPSQRPKPAAGKSKPGKNSRRLPYLSYTDGKGNEYRVGRGARENDELTFRHSRGNDVWFHVRGRPGAHVVLCRPGPSPSSESLLIGAQLALAHSRIKEGAREEVSWTRVKELRKTKDLGPGRVLLRSEKVLWVEARRAELDVLQRLNEH